MRFHLYLLFALLPLITHSQDRMADSLVLVDLYQTLDGPNWTISEPWLAGQPLQDWEGITLDSDGRVIQIVLINKGLAGPFPTRITELDQLRTLEISRSQLTGQLPADLGQLTRLQRFAINSNALTGPVPDVFHLMPQMNALILSNNDFTGSLPSLPPDIDFFYAQDCSFSGPLPSSWANHPNISNINLQGNQLTGSFDLLASWTKLNTLTLNQNNWDPAPFPTWLNDLPDLRSFSCSNCQLIGELPSELDFSDQPNYYQSVISNNELSGDISLLFPDPTHGQKLYLQIRFNNFSGSFPAHLIPAASIIDISNNQFHESSAFPDSTGISNLNVNANLFNFEGLAPLAPIAADDQVNMRYNSQQALLSLDTITVSTAQSIELQAGDYHPNTTYQWRKNSVAIEGATESTYTIDIDASTKTAKYDCFMYNSDFPDLTLRRHLVRVVIDITTDVDRLEEDWQPIIYPNPASTFIHIDHKNEGGIWYTLSSHAGRTILSGQLDHSGRIDIAHITSGTYVLTLRNDRRTSSKQITIF